MIQPNTPEPLVFRARSPVGEPVTGLTVTVRVFNPANGQIWDWASSAFSASPSQATATMTEINASTLPGYYYRSWPGAAEGVYLAEYSPAAGITADDYPDPVELRVADVALAGDAMTLTAGERTTVQALILNDATPFAGAAVGEPPDPTAIAAAVWATATDNADWTYGACVSLSRKHITNRLDVTAAGSGTETLYDDDGTTAIVTQTLRDAAGGAIVVPTGSPALRGAAT